MAYEIILLAFAMSIDAFAVSFSLGCRYNTPRHYFRISWHFGLFQSIFPLIGAFIGSVLFKYFNKFEILAGVILFIIAYKMFKDSLKNDDERCYIKDPTKGYSLIFLSSAISIDALGVGFVFPLLEGEIFINSAIIGIVCLIFSILGVFFGSKSKNFFGKYAEKFGAAVLFIIGIKFMVV